MFTTNSASDRQPSPRQMACKFGSSCVKFGCPFKHPPSRPQDCPDGECCDEAKCPLHHPKSRPIRQHKYPQLRLAMHQTKRSRAVTCPTAISFSDLRMNLTPTMRRVRATSRYSNRKIIRSPMVVASLNTRPTTGYFAATTKPCVHGAACVKYGCTYKHPASRAAVCPLGLGCNDANCARLHPLNEHGTGAIDAGFAVDQRVQAKYLPNSTNWSHATIRLISGSAITLQFDGFADTFKMPLRRVRPNSNPNTNPSHDNAQWVRLRPHTPPPSSPPPSSPPPPRSSQPVIEDLQRLKLAAVAREDFLAAAQIKDHISTLEKIIHLEKQKQQAVRDEDFVLAMDIKKQIADLEYAQQSTAVDTK